MLVQCEKAKQRAQRMRCVYMRVCVRAQDESVEIITLPKWHEKEAEKQGEMRMPAVSATTFVTCVGRLQRWRNRTANFAIV